MSSRAQVPAAVGPRTRRRGVGTVLILVMILLVTLVVIGFSHGRFASSVANEVRRDTLGDRCLELATDALAATHFVIARAVNDPAAGGELYRLFRSQLGGTSTRVELAALPWLRAELDRHRGFALEGDAVGVEVSAHLPTSLANPTEYDRCTTVRLTAAVSHAESGAVRRLVETYDVKVALAGSPRPFDLATFAVGDPSELLDQGAWEHDANLTIKLAVRRPRQIKGMASLLQQKFFKLQGALSKRTDAPGKEAAKQVSEARRLLRELRTALLPGLLFARRLGPSGPREVHLFAPRPFALFCNAPTVQLQAFDLPTRVGRLVAGLRDFEPRFRTANDALVAFIKSFETTPVEQWNLAALPGLQKAWCDAALPLCKSWHDAGLEYKALQDACVEITGPAFAEVSPYLQALEAGDFDLRAAALVGQGDVRGHMDARTVDEKLTRLLERGEAWNGVLIVDNPSEELTVDREFKGDLVLVVLGDATVRRAVVADPSRDRLTIVCGGRLSLQGPVQGSVVTGRCFLSEPEVAITGNLIARTVSFQAGPPDRVMAGTITRTPATVTGPALADKTLATVNMDAQMVSLGPYAVTAAFERR